MRSWSSLRSWLAVVLTGCALVVDVAGCGGDDSGSLSAGDASGGDVTTGDGMSAGDADAAMAMHDADAAAKSDGDAMVTGDTDATSPGFGDADAGTTGDADAMATGDADATMMGTGDADAAAATGDADADAATMTLDADAAAPDADAAPAMDADAAPPEQCTGAPDAGPLSITAVYASRIGQDLHLEVHGAGFGLAPTPLPAVGFLNQFRITDTTQGSWCAGSAGCAVYLQYTSWSDTAIVVDGFGLQYGHPYKMLPGDMVSISVQSTAVASNTVTFTCTLQNDPLPAPDDGGPTPEVSSVVFSQIGQNMHIEVDGAGFGSAPTALPAVGFLNQFYITDTTQGGWCAGSAGCAVYLQYTSWSDTAIVIDGFGHQYGGQHKVAFGDVVSIFIQNAQGPEFTIWTGPLPMQEPDAAPPPDGGPTPRVASVTFGQVGQNMHIEVDGAGFGSAPTTLPAVGFLNQFYITDTTQGGWCAGSAGCAVYLHYTSWTDARVVIDGFGPQYGGQYKVVSGDAVSIYIQNAQGPEFMIWTGTLP